MSEDSKALIELRKTNQNLERLISAMTTGSEGDSGMGVVSPANISLPRTHDESGKTLLDWGWLTFDMVVPANGPTVVTRMISASFHFHVMFFDGNATDPDQLSIKIKDGRSSEELELLGQWIHWNNLVGTTPAGGLSTANAPYTLGGFRRFAAGTTITVEFADTSGSENTVQFVMHGVKEIVQFK